MNTNNNNRSNNKKAKKDKKIILHRPEFGFTVNVKAGYPKKNRKGGPVVKFFDNNLFSITVSSTPTIQGLFAPAQGTGLTQRIGDVTYLHKMYMTYTCNAANADIYSSMRVIIFQWIPNNGLVAPVYTDLLQTSADTIYSMYDWNYSDQYRILYDKLHSFSGTATAPTASTNQCVSEEVSLTSAFKKVNFTIGATTCSNSIYVLAVSDSVIAPFPNFVLKTRIEHEEE